MTGRPVPADKAAFIRTNTTILVPPHVPEIALHLADEAHDLWLRTEQELADIGLPPPFWGFAWAGGQGLARYLLDHPETVKGKTMLDFATGSGLVAIAAAMAGAEKVMANDTDPFCDAAVKLNAAHNAVSIDFLETDLIDRDDDWEVVLAGDVFYDKELATRLQPWFSRLHSRGCEVLIGDPGRSYLPQTGLQRLATYQIAVTRALEDAETKKTTVWRVLGELS